MPTFTLKQTQLISNYASPMDGLQHVMVLAVSEVHVVGDGAHPVSPHVWDEWLTS